MNVSIPASSIHKPKSSNPNPAAGIIKLAGSK